jgi:chemotaxis protein CheX
VNTAPVSAQDLREVTEEVWESFINPDGDPAAGRLRAVPAPVRPSGVWATVSVAGAWHGAIVVSCSPAAASRLASVLLDLPEPRVTDVDVEDALGELANIIGGNIKGLLPGPSRLSLPRIVMRPDAWIGWSADDSCQLAVDWYDEPVLVTVLAGGAGTTNGRDGVAA